MEINLETLSTNRNKTNSSLNTDNNYNSDDCISRVPFHVQHAQLH